MPILSRVSLQRVIAMAAMTALVSIPGTRLTAAPAVERRTLGGSAVAIYDLAGKISVDAAPSGQVEVQATLGGGDAGKLRIETGPIEEWQTYRVIFPDDRITYGDKGTTSRLTVGDDGRFDDKKLLPSSGRHTVEISGKAGGLDAYADLAVRVPTGRKVALFLGAGEMTITNVDGDLKVRVASADVTTRSTRGSLDVDAGSGRLRVSDASGSVALDTGSGSTIVRGVRGDRLLLDSGSGSVTVLDAELDQLTADTGSGSVEISDARIPEMALDCGSGSVRLNLLKGPLRSLDIDSGSGGVTIGVPRELDASFDVDAGSGGIDISVPHQIERQSSGHVRGRFGAGRGHIHIDSGSGSVRIVPHSSSTYLLPGAGVGSLIRYGIA